ncbi:RpiR family transcriptional regulator [Glaciihabitans tibetensis]|uniref:RpiR family transcriptional regulator n=1 Tax=Glaciihabitans tibetensis TaxID=1266600 RepID=A0A2T0VFR2_9MICO|nr:MurR/RpiR family transcriptional regulator [Glaciihabitans tibetensis]PRY69057.1 RpiR family transcriptional regulator [Glaciihabitans tibetensis]
MTSPSLAHPEGDIGQRLSAAMASLSPQELRAAEFMRDHLADLGLYNAAEVARLSGVSKATISRLYRRLGFGNAEEVRDHVRALRSSGTPVAADGPVSFASQIERESLNLHAALGALNLPEIAPLIAGARRVLVVGFRNSYPVALHLRQQLAQARDGVSLAPLPGQSLGEELASLDGRDVIVVVGFRRRPELFPRLIAATSARPTPVVLLGDEGARRYSTQVQHFVVCPVDSVTAFDSYAAAFSVVSLIAAAVLGENLRVGRSRVAEIGLSYGELDELERF